MLAMASKPVCVAGWAAWFVWLATTAWPSHAADDESCPYLRLALSTPQRVQKQAGDAELQADYLHVFAEHLGRAGFDVREPSATRVSWELFSQVEPLARGQIAWSYALLPMPGLADGMIEFPTFSLIVRPSGERVRFTTYHGLEHMRKGDFPLRAALAAEKLANLYLPVALDLCSKRGSEPDFETTRLERIRNELTAEIERVRQRAEQRKRLELRPEPDDPATPDE